MFSNSFFNASIGGKPRDYKSLTLRDLINLKAKNIMHLSEKIDEEHQIKVKPQTLYAFFNKIKIINTEDFCNITIKNAEENFISKFGESLLDFRLYELKENEDLLRQKYKTVFNPPKTNITLPAEPVKVIDIASAPNPGKIYIEHYKALTIRNLIELKARTFEELSHKIYDNYAFQEPISLSAIVVFFQQTIKKLFTPEMICNISLDKAKIGFESYFGEDLVELTLAQLEQNLLTLIKKSNQQTQAIITKSLNMQNPPIASSNNWRKTETDSVSIATSTSGDSSTLLSSQTSSADELSNFSDESTIFADLNETPLTNLSTIHFESLTPRKLIELNAANLTELYQKTRGKYNISCKVGSFKTFFDQSNLLPKEQFFKLTIENANQYFQSQCGENLLDVSLFDLSRREEKHTYKLLTLKEIMALNLKSVPALFAAIQGKFSDVDGYDTFYNFFRSEIIETIGYDTIFDFSLERAKNYFQTHFGEDLLDKTLYELSKRKIELQHKFAKAPISTPPVTQLIANASRKNHILNLLQRKAPSSNTPNNKNFNLPSEMLNFLTKSYQPPFNFNFLNNPQPIPVINEEDPIDIDECFEILEQNDFKQLDNADGQNSLNLNLTTSSNKRAQNDQNFDQSTKKIRRSPNI